MCSKRRVEEEKVMVELMGENKVFFSVSFHFHPSIHHHVITVRADHRDTLKSFSASGFPVFVYVLFVCMKAGQAGCVCSPLAKKPLHSHS